MTYPGGKNGSGVYQAIINLMPPHRTYIEPFLGGGAIMRLKRPAIANIGIDSDDTIDHNYPVGVTVIHGDGISFLGRYDWQGDELVYCDPPYLMETRSSQRPLYRHEMTTGDHELLLRTICMLPVMVMVMISGYYSEMYMDLLAGWRSANFQAMTRSGQMATEWVWMNFPPSLELHDYRYLGRDFRERERIKRKKLRWIARLQRMTSLERNAMMMAIQEFRSSTAGDGDAHVSTAETDDARATPEVAIAAGDAVT
jgi:DNA adenine methylase